MANPEFDKGLEGWGVFGHGKIEVKRSRMGNKFIVAKHRTQPHDSFSQWLHLQEGHYYTFSGNFGILFLFQIYKHYHCLIRLLPVILWF